MARTAQTARKSTGGRAPSPEPAKKRNREARDPSHKGRREPNASAAFAHTDLPNGSAAKAAAAAAATEIDLLVNGQPLVQQVINGKVYVEVPGPGAEFAVRVRAPQRPDLLGFRLLVDGCVPPHWYRAHHEKIIDTFPVDKDWGRKLAFGAPEADHDTSGWAIGDGRFANEEAGLGCVRVRVFKLFPVARRWQAADTYDYSLTRQLVKPQVFQCGDNDGVMLKTTAELGNPTPNPRPLEGQWVDVQCPTNGPLKEIVFHYRSKAQLAGIAPAAPAASAWPTPAKAHFHVKEERETKRRKRAGDNQTLAIQLD